MKEQLISFETAKLAKEKGFNLKIITRFDINGKLDYSLYNRDNNSIRFDNSLPNGKPIKLFSAPTQSFLQKWLREEHNIHIEVFLSENIPYNIFHYRIMEIGKYFTLSYDAFSEKTFEKTLEQGLYKALKLI